MSDTESTTPSEAGSQSKRHRMKAFLKENWAKGVDKAQDEMLKGKMKLQQSLGLGHKPNAIPPGPPSITGDQRPVHLAWHPVGGFAGKWFAEETGLGKMITEKIHKYPDPSQHWGVIVGDFCHQLWMDEHLDVIYINEQIKREEWTFYDVGHTTFNDEALRQTGEMVIYSMRAKKAAYNLISNNCQNFAMLMLNAIHVGAHREFATSYAVWQRATGKGSIRDLFKPDDATSNDEEEQKPPEAGHQEAMQHAHQVMEQNTTHLDTHGHHDHCGC